MGPKKLKPERAKTKRNSAPQAQPGQVTGFWARELRDDGYRSALVKVKSRKGSALSFFLVDARTGTVEGGRTAHTVDLDDGKVVWGELPSTAQLVTNDSALRYGLLFLAPDWLARRGYSGGGLKWPKLA